MATWVTFERANDGVRILLNLDNYVVAPGNKPNTITVAPIFATNQPALFVGDFDGITIMLGASRG